MELCNHKVVLPYEVVGAREGELVAQVFTTFGITKNGIVKFTFPEFDDEVYRSDKKMDQELLDLLEKPLMKEKVKKDQ